MSRAELLQALSKLIDSGLRGAEDHAEEALLKEALRREGQAVLLRQELLAKVDIIFDAFKLVKFNAHHHVHGGAASDRSYTSDGAEAGKRGLRRGRQLLLHRFKVTVGHFGEDAGQRLLDERVRVQLDHRVHVESGQHVVEVSLVVVHDGPAAAPAWQAVDFRDRASADDGDSACALSHGDEWALRVVRETVIDLVRDDGDLELVGDGQDFLDVLRREAGAARVRWVIDKDCFGSIRDLTAQMVQVDLPALIGQQVILVEFNIQILADWLAEWEAWFRNENAIADFTENSNRIVKCAGAAEGQEDVVWVDRVIHSAELLRNGGARGHGARRSRVAVVLFALDCLNDRFVDHRR